LECVQCQINDDCGSTSKICLNGACVSKGTTGTLGCASVENCEAGCFDIDCPSQCDAAATYVGALLYNALTECLWLACSNGDPVCMENAALQGGQCYAQSVACQQDP
jgi:hypothetical protein